MNDFLQQVWFDNPVKDYLIVVGVILFVLLLKRLISRYVAGLLYRLIKKNWKEVEKRTFVNLIVQPLGNLLVLLTAVIALYTLEFPSQLEGDVYGYSSKRLVHAIGTIILIISFTSVILRFIDFIAIILELKANRTPDQADNQLIVFFKDFFKVIVVIIGIMLVLKFAFGFAIGSLLTGLSIVGAAIALALRESLENLIASFIIFFDKPFTTGDVVKVVNVTGTVERIGLRSTRIRTERKTYVTVPNKQMVDTVLDNLSLSTQRRIDLKLEIDATTYAPRLDALVIEIRKILTRREIEEAQVHLLDITSQAYIVVVEYYTGVITMSEFNALRQEVNLEILRKMQSMDIRLAGDRQNVKATDSKKT